MGEAMRYVSESGLRLFRVADLECFPSDVTSGSVSYELRDGQLITLPSHSVQHGSAVATIATELLLQGEQPGHGKARCVGPAVIVRRDPDHVLVPDAVFLAASQLPTQLSPEDYLETIPAHLVEVREKWDSLAALRRRCEDYLKAGARMVWVVDLVHRNVIEYRHDDAPTTYRDSDTLTGADIIPGFSLPVVAALQE